ncbi:MAG: hypothetical protein LBI91_07035 [Spirochaetaceae bacterium]|jgi:hypothetical protein|nr:hypothetical protein [Spirochaetaceae bacterium]
MTLLKKAAFSLVLALLLFAGFALAAYTGLFGLIETRFYNPSVSRAALKEAEQDRDVIQAYFAGLDAIFSAFTGEQALRRSFLPVRNEEDVLERERLSALLLEKQPGLLSVRFIDADGSRIHYSTLEDDVLVEGPQPLYRNYETGPGNPRYESLEASARGASRLILDGRMGRIIFFYPFYDALDIYRGIAVFTLAADSLAGVLEEFGRMGIRGDAVLLGEPPGVILGIPRNGEDAVIGLAAGILEKAGNRRGEGRLSRIAAGDGNAPAVLAWSQTSGGVFTGRIINENLFVFSAGMRGLLLLSFFLTSFLTIFLLFNLRADPMAVVRNRLRGIRTAVLEECRNRKNTALPLRSWEMEQRREEMRQEIKRIAKIKPGKGRGNAAGQDQGRASRRAARQELLEKEIDSYFDFAWNELAAVVGRLAISRGGGPAGGRAEGAKRAPGGRYAEKPADRETPQPVQAGKDQAAKLEPVEVRTALLSRPFAFTPELYNRPEPLAAFPSPAGKNAAPERAETAGPADGEPVFKTRNGITYINRPYTAPDGEAAKNLGLDEDFKDLVDSVINDAKR